MNDDQLLEYTIAALESAIDEYRGDSPPNSLAGVALVTDDGASTLSTLAVGKGDLTGSADPDLLYTPTDWPHELAPSAFERSDQELRRRNGSCRELRQHVDESFALLVRALSAIRHDAIVGEDVFLTVLSCDPSGHLEALEADGIAKLNPNSLVDGWRAFLAKWK